MTTVEEEESPPIDPPRRSFSLVRTQRTLQIILGLFWLLDAGLQFQPFMFGSGFTTTYLLNNAQNQPDIDPMDHHQCGTFRGTPRRRVEHVLCPSSGGHRRRLALSAHRAPCPSGVVLLGLWRLVLRGGSRPDLHGFGFRPHRCAGVSVHLWTDRHDGVASLEDKRRYRPTGWNGLFGSGSGHRGSDHSAVGVERLLVACRDPVPASGQSDHDLGVKRHHRHVVG